SLILSKIGRISLICVMICAGVENGCGMGKGASDAKQSPGRLPPLPPVRPLAPTTTSEKPSDAALSSVPKSSHSGPKSSIPSGASSSARSSPPTMVTYVPF
ncbi:MAG: hypothetical protein LBS23_01080, partial [Holosporaceae bacterium]|nr:hypothetical protein [Holosporaceae bacterium]